MKDIADEISEDLQQEKLVRFAHKYGKWALCAALALVLGVALYIYTHDRTVAKQEEVSTEYYKLFDPAVPLSHPQRKAEILDFIKRHKGNIYAELATLQLGHAKNESAAQSLLDLINTSKRIETINGAKIRLAIIALNNNLPTYKQQSITLLQEGVKQGGLMVNSMRIMLAQLLLDAGDKDKAKAVLLDLNDSAAASEQAKFIANVLGDQ